jgi:uncharacterized protein
MSQREISSFFRACPTRAGDGLAGDGSDNQDQFMEISGPAGALEARYQAAARPRAAQAVLCHPHPQYGGSMHDPVLDCAAGVLLDAGMGVLRFNFRGVGRSQGSYDGGRGEVDDLTAAVTWLRDGHPGAALWLGGYSFGAHVVWQALTGAVACDRALLLAPPVGPMTFPPRQLPFPVDVFAGDADEFLDPRALAAWTDVAVHRILGADHYFTGRFDDLAARIREVIAPPWEERG